MKPKFEKFCCPQCGELRFINVNGLCFDCFNEQNLITLAKQRKQQQKINYLDLPLAIES